jgi:hypothetical protein
MRPIQPRLKGFKTEAPPLFEASDDANDLRHEVVRLDVPKESDADDSGSESGENFPRRGSLANPKTRPTKKHAWRAPNVTADPFDDPLH